MGIRFGRYQTLEPIAAGGMAKVYRGRALAEGGFERIVAIKVMHPHLASDPEFVDMFLDEARLAARIQHPNVVATHDVMRSPAGTFLVMDYVDGVDFGLLQRYLRGDARKLPLAITLRIVIDALNGLAAAHELAAPDGTPLHLVHRDVSPQNILLDATTGTTRLTDFGVAHAAERLSTTEGGALKGKLGYLSPEHARDGTVDARSDVYSAGVLLWEALTGKPMFAGRARMRVLADIVQGNLTPPREVEPSVPEQISQACMIALALEPERRFQSARAFAQRLRSAALLAHVDVASEETVQRFLAECGVRAFARRQHARLEEDEQTVLEAPPAPRPAPRAAVPPPKRRRVWWLAAALVAPVLIGLPLLPRDAPSSPARVELPERGSAQPDSVPSGGLRAEVEELARAEPSPPRAEDAPEPMPKKAAKPPSRRMYHPKGL